MNSSVLAGRAALICGSDTPVAIVCQIGRSCLPTRTSRPRGRFVHALVHETWRHRLRRGDAEDLGRLHAADLPRPARRPETARDGRDECRMAHNPEVEGSNPSPATSEVFTFR